MKTTTESAKINVNVKNFMDWAISSQASLRKVEGSTTRLDSLFETMKAHECSTPHEGDDIVYSVVKATEAEIKNSALIQKFGVTLDLIPNRLQPSVSAVSQAFLIDPQHLRLSYLHSPRVESLAKTGLGEKRLMSADWTFVVTTEKAHGVILDIDNTLDVVSAI